MAPLATFLKDKENLPAVVRAALTRKETTDNLREAVRELKEVNKELDRAVKHLAWAFHQEDRESTVYWSLQQRYFRREKQKAAARVKELKGQVR